MRAIVAALALGSRAALAAPGDALRVEEVLWSGHPDGMERPQDPWSLELAPGGRGFLYYQGRPSPAVMLQPVEAGAAALRVGGATPFGRRAPRFDPLGRHVYFTALEPGARPDPSSSSLLRTHAVRVTLPGMKVEHLFPERGSSTDAFAVLLDVHPSGERLLVGTGRGLTGAKAAQDDYALELAEVPAAGGAPSPLGLRLSAGGAASYAPGGAPVVEPTAGAIRGAALAWRRAGDREVASFLVPHRGSFGWDGALTFAVRAPPGGASAGAAGGGEAPGPARPLRFAERVSSLLPVPPQPVSFRGERVLLCAGTREAPIPIVARLASGAGGDAEDVPGDAPARALLLDLRLLDGEVLARRSTELEPVLRGVQAALRAPGGAIGGRPGDVPRGAPAGRPGAPARPGALRARLVERGFGPLAGLERRIEVTETAAGYLRIERLPAEGPAGERDPAPEDAVLAFDGRACWAQAADGRCEPLDPALFCRELNAHSLYRLLLDPAGLADPRLRFEPAPGREPGAAAGGAARRLAFSYDDGYRGDLLLEPAPGGLRPASLRSPLLFASEELRRQMGQVPAERSVSFEDWREWNGRMVPHRLRFDDGLNPRAVEVQALEALEAADPALFRAPGSGG
ncbi:MAG: hypothetical protein HY721_08460 [Planctomycetes bacterium]|nr:hypothetical protein [Planctomycetota bacterium]